MSHTGERPHSCPVAGCLKKFTEKGNMKTHLKTHVTININESLKKYLPPCDWKILQTRSRRMSKVTQ